MFYECLQLDGKFTPLRRRHMESCRRFYCNLKTTLSENLAAADSCTRNEIDLLKNIHDTFLLLY
jgi:hypothetical protein